MDQTDKYFGNYLGIVVRSDDPEGRNRVKVFIPHISATLYQNWNAIPEDKIFNFNESGSAAFQNVMSELMIVLPWAECAAPLIGSAAAGRHNSPAATAASPSPTPVPTPQPGPAPTPAPTNTIADGNFKNPAPNTGNIDPSGLTPTNSAVFGTNFDGSPDNTDVGDPHIPFPHTGSGGANLLDRNLAGVALSPSQSQAFFGEGPAAAAASGKTICVVNTQTGASTVANVVDTGPSYKNQVEATPQVWRNLGYNNIHELANAGDVFAFAPDCNAADSSLTEKPALAVEKSQPTDGHSDSMHDPVRRANAYSNTYAAHAYSNVAKGFFSTPNVGAHVWCFFHGGDPMRPVYFAASFGATDYAGVKAAGSDQQDDKRYSRENPSFEGSNNDRYRGSLVLNERGGAFEIINTEGREMMSLVGYHGNNLKMGEHMSMYCANNDQKLVAKDQFLTVNHDRNEVVRRHYDLVVYGDILRKTGHINSYLDIYQKIYNVIKPTHDKIALYEKKRSPEHLSQYGRGSSQQTRSGQFAKCPVCTPGETYTSRIGAADTFTPNLTLDVAPLVDTHGSLSQGTSQAETKTWGTGGQIFSSECLTCGGSGNSPSSQQGQWEDDQSKQQAAQDMVNQIDQLADLEAQLGPGGSEIVTVAKDYTITVGLLLNDMASVRTDPNGKILPRGMKVGKQGIYRDKHDAPIMEIVPQHPAFPGGNYDLTVMNRYNVMVGSGGIFFKTKGVVQIGGTVTNLNGDQILITSANETKITGGKSFSVAADLISLAPSSDSQVIIDGGLAVARNTILAGGLHVEGELTVHHVTAPVEWQLTELDSPGGLTRTDKIIGYVYNVEPGTATLPVYGSAIPDTLVVDAHRHYFKNLPLSLNATSDDVRTSAMPNNDPKMNVAQGKYTAGGVGPTYSTSG